MSKRLTYRHMGMWGIEGVELGQLPPKVYGALCKLRDLEDLLEAIHQPGITEECRMVLVEELVGRGG